MKQIIVVMIMLMLQSCNNVNQKERMEDFDKIYSSASIELMAIKGVAGVGQGKTDDGEDCIIIFVSDSKEIPKEIPKSYKKITVKIQEIGRIDAQ